MEAPSHEACSIDILYEWIIYNKLWLVFFDMKLNVNLKLLDERRRTCDKSELFTANESTLWTFIPLFP
jgi:hypothetical protein